MSHRRKSSPIRRLLFGSAWATAAMTALLAAAALWLLATQSGARFALERAAALVNASVGPVEGRLVGPLRVGSVEFVTPDLHVRAANVAFDWSPLRLFDGELRFKRLHVASVEIATAATGEPLREPATLALPFRLFVEQAGADRLRVATIGDEKNGVELREVALKLRADEAAWILGAAEAATPAGRVRISGTMGARAPFLLDAKGELNGTRGGAPYRAFVEAKGRLAKFEATLAVREGAITGTGAASLEPFSEAPLRRLKANLDGVDLAQFAAAPHTNLALEADLAPDGESILAGPLKIVNAIPGTLDKERLPIASAVARLALAKDRVEASGVVLSLAGGGRAEGRARWSGGKLDAKVAVRDADLLAWHASLKATKLTGEIKAVASAKSQSFAVALVDPRFDFQGEARIADGRLTVERARLARGRALAQARATLALEGKREFALEGRVERLDPAAFAEVPAGDINAVFSAKGSLGKVPAGEAVLAIAQSRFAGLPAKGQLAATVEGARLSRTEADLSLGATRLVAKGALGRVGDTLEIGLVSPDLAPLGRAFGFALGGTIDLEARLAGELAAPSGRASLEAKDLVLPGDLRLAMVKGRLSLGSGDAGAANGSVELRGLARQAEKTPDVERASLAIRGTRIAHEVRLEMELPDKTSARILLDGGLVPGARAPEWRGRLESLETAGRAAFALAAPTPLFVSAERIELGEALFAGDPGQVRLALARWTPAGIESRGSSKAVVVRSIQRLLRLEGAVGSNLVLAGDWDVRAGETLEGFVSLRRESGDVRIGQPRQALGLEALTLRADASGGRVQASVDVRGKQVGQWKAQAAATIARGVDGWDVAAAAPLEGRFTIDVPDLSWTAAWIGPDALARGRFRGEGSLTGTAREPSWRGRVEVTGIAVREPTLGAEVADGTIAIALKDREARIERFELAMPWQPSNEAARALAAAKRPATGTVTAEGAVDLGTRKGRFRVKASGYPLTRLTNRFIAVSGEGQAELDGRSTLMTGDFTADAGWFGIPASAPPALSSDVIVDRGIDVPVAAETPERIRLDLRVDLGQHLHFRGRGLSTRLAGSLRLAGEVGTNLRATGTIRAVGGTYDAYGRTLAIERGAINFQGAVDNPGLNVLALRKGLPVEAGVEVLGSVARPKVRLYSSPDVPDPEKLAWLVLGRGQGDVTAADAGLLLGAANSLLGSDKPASAKILGGLGLDEVSMGRDESGNLGTLPQSTVAGRTGAGSAAEVVTVGKRLSDDIYISYRQGLADAQGSLRVAWQLTRTLQLILRAGYLPGVDAVYRFSFK